MTKQTINKRVKQFYWEDEQISVAIKELQEAQSIWATRIDLERTEDDELNIYAVWEILESDDEYEKRLAIEKLSKEYIERSKEYIEWMERNRLRQLRKKYES